MIWPASFSLVRAYLDQLERDMGLGPEKIASARSELVRSEGLSGQNRRDLLAQLASRLHAEARGAPAERKAQLLASAVGELAKK